MTRKNINPEKLCKKLRYAKITFFFLLPPDPLFPWPGPPSPPRCISPSGSSCEIWRAHFKSFIVWLKVPKLSTKFALFCKMRIVIFVRRILILPILIDKFYKLYLYRGSITIKITKTELRTEIAVKTKTLKIERKQKIKNRKTERQKTT